MKAARATVLLLAVAGVSAAQSRTTLVDAPLAVLLPMPEEDVQALQSEFRQALARHDAVLLPTRTNWNKAVAAVGRKDCGVHDECLQQLAIASGALYALFASVERNATATELTLTGRVVDRDGRTVRARVRVTFPATGRAAIQTALQQLVHELELDALPAVLASRSVESSTAPLARPELSSDPPARVAAWVTLGAAISAAATSAAFGLSAASQLGSLPAGRHFLTEEQAERQLQANRSATISLGTGIGAGALLATSLSLFFVSGPVKVTAGPTRGGAAVFASGEF